MTKPPAAARLTANDHAAILAAVTNGVTMRKVAHLFGITTAVAAGIVRQLGEPECSACRRKNCQYYLDRAVRSTPSTTTSSGAPAP